MLDKEVREKFKIFQKSEAGRKYRDLDIDDVRFEKEPLSDVSLISMGQSPEGIYLNKNGEGKPFFQGKTDYGKIYLKEPSTWTIKSKKEAKKNDILISLRAPAGAINIANIDCSIGRGLASIRCISRVSLLYLYYYLKNNEIKISNDNENGGFFSSMNKDYLYDIAVPIPKDLDKTYTSFKIQEAIVAFLEFWKDGYTDIFRERVSKKKPIYETIKRVVVKNTFKDDKFLVKKFNEFSKIKGYNLILTDIKFKKKYLKTLVSTPVKGGGTPDTKVKDYWYDDLSLIDNVNYFGWRNIEKKLFNKKTISKYSKVISKNGFNSCSTWLVPSHSILIAIASASKGLIVMNDNPMCTNQNILGVVINNDNHTEYIYYFLKNTYMYLDGKKEFGNLTKGSEENREILIPQRVNDYSSKEIQYLLVEFWEMIIEQIDKQLAIYQRMLEVTDIIDRAFLYRTFGKIDWSKE